MRAESSSSRPVRISVRKKVFFSCVLAVCLLALLEIACRLTGLGATRETHQDISNWNLQWKSDFYVFDVQQTDPAFGINTDGLRDRTHLEHAAADTLRVVCLGDSVTYGYGVSWEKSYPRFLERELNKSGNVEVFNVALPGWSTRQQRIAYERIVRRYRPDYVILGVCLNDIPEMHNNLASPPPRFVGMLYRHSNFVRCLLPGQQHEIHQVAELLTHPDAPRVRAAWEMALQEIHSLARMVEADGAQFGLLVFPFRRQVLPDPPPAGPQEEFRQYCQTEKVRFWDAREALQQLGTQGFIDYDHLSAEGATAVARQISQSRWIAPHPARDKPLQVNTGQTESP